MGGGKSTDNHNVIVLLLLMWLYTTPQSYDFFLKLPRISGESFEKSILTVGLKRAESPNLSLLPQGGGEFDPFEIRVVPQLADNFTEGLYIADIQRLVAQSKIVRSLRTISDSTVELYSRADTL